MKSIHCQNIFLVDSSAMSFIPKMKSSVDENQMNFYFFPSFFFLFLFDTFFLLFPFPFLFFFYFYYFIFSSCQRRNLMVGYKVRDVRTQAFLFTCTYTCIKLFYSQPSVSDTRADYIDNHNVIIISPCFFKDFSYVCNGSVNWHRNK